ncbi:hypothetical protein OS493_019636 [Desmophyllum pertusum]|uniref:Uncharacterized protein n=1 Tax=Desmophyllum pertusum TaxID=174260 RepID=A0A9W9ZCR1_9CNID|nr:hypothetical protein OS493_019636 [Desmophyllum pertusum]
MAFVTTDFCNDNRTRCALKDSRRKSLKKRDSPRVMPAGDCSIHEKEDIPVISYNSRYYAWSIKNPSDSDKT